jgi:hypothetical protein
MRNQGSYFSHAPRQRPLVACLAAVLGLGLSAANAFGAEGAGNGPPPSTNTQTYPAARSGVAVAAKGQTSSKRGPTPHGVTTCDDDISNPNSLRAQVATAMSGDEIDLSALMCSTITLSSTIPVLQDSLYLKGPADRVVTIDGGGHGRIFAHSGSGTLHVAYLTVSNGYYVGSTGYGGCIYSRGDVLLTHSVVSHCTVESGSVAVGGAVYTGGALGLYYSTITDSHVFSSGTASLGGGAYVHGDFKAFYSTISNNTANTEGVPHGSGGGVFVFGSATMGGSTISGNRADFVGALGIGAGGSFATIGNSTISGNVANQFYGGISTRIPLTVSNSTIAFNQQGSGANSGGGLYAQGAQLTLQSSIIADNVSGGAPGDVDGSGTISNTSADNLITATPLDVPLHTVTLCPKLQPLANNGGGTLTHVPMHTSPAIDAGNAPVNLPLDQRFAPRWVGAKPDIGSVEWQVGEKDERIFVDGLDGLCDQ